MKHWMLAAILTLCGTATAWAQDVSYVERSWDSENKTVVSTTKTLTSGSYTAINGNEPENWVPLADGWWVVTANSEYKTLNVTGTDVKLIIPDGVTLTLTGGLKLESDATSSHKLTIYGQSSNTGTLTVTNSYSGAAGIGGGEGASCGTLEIHGGDINATGGTYAAGIGGGEKQGFYGSLTIYGGNVTAQGGNYAAGIGSGDENPSNTAGFIYIYGGTVTATGGIDAAGIGGGNEGAGAVLNIYGGTVTATGGNYGAGIGSGDRFTSNVAGYINIYDGTVTATGGTDAAGIGGGRQGQGAILHIYGGRVNAKRGNMAAAIGGGRYSNGVQTYIDGGIVTAIGCIGGGHPQDANEGNGGYIEINGGTVTAGGSDTWASNQNLVGAGIGCGPAGESATIKITGGTVTAIAGSALAAGIGGGGGGKGPTLDITITGGTVTAMGYQGIGAGYAPDLRDERFYKGTLNITGGKVYATGIKRAVGGGNGETFASSGMTLYGEAMVKAGATPDEAVLFSAGERVSACVWRKHAAIEPCTHSGASYTISGTSATDTHTKHCNYCATAFEAEQHTFTDGKCSVCGVEATAYTVTIYYPQSATDNDYTSITYQMVPGTTLKMPAPPMVPAKMEFAGWLVGTHSNGSFIATEDEKSSLFEEGVFYTVNNNVTLTARFQNLDINLSDNADNSETLVKYLGMTARSVTLNGRTLYKDGSWNTLCLPFAVTDFTDTPLQGATVKTLSSTSFSDGTLTLNFSDDLTTIEAGKPYIVKWTKADNYVAYDGTNAATCSDIVTLVFTNVTISSSTTDIETDEVTFKGIFSPYSASGEDNTKLYLGADNTLYYPNGAMTIGSCRAYFQLADGITAGAAAGVRAFVLNFGDEASGIGEISTSRNDNMPNVGWYTLDGRRLSGRSAEGRLQGKKPIVRGLYINNGKKIIIK